MMLFLISSALRLLTIRELERGEETSLGLGTVLKFRVPSCFLLFPPMNARFVSKEALVEPDWDFIKSRAPIMLSIVLLFFLAYVPWASTAFRLNISLHYYCFSLVFEELTLGFLSFMASSVYFFRYSEKLFSKQSGLIYLKAASNSLSVSPNA